MYYGRGEDGAFTAEGVEKVTVVGGMDACQGDSGGPMYVFTNGTTKGGGQERAVQVRVR